MFCVVVVMSVVLFVRCLGEVVFFIVLGVDRFGV